MCTGMYTKACTDLAKIGAQYGMDINFFYLFNESLIQRARNYLVDSFLRSDYTHLMFIDSDIGFNPHDVISLAALAEPDSGYDIVCGPYPKKCLHNTNTIETEDGKKTIAQIVREKYTGKVKSLNSSNEIVWKNVLNHWSEKNYG